MPATPGHPTQLLDAEISCIDTGLHRPGMVACYLIESQGKAGFIDTGVGASMPVLLQALKKRRLAPEDVEYIMPTHVHLDHAGAAGHLMQEFPNAVLLVHPRGARHLIDPQKLQAGVEAVYGKERFNTLFGALLAVDKERVVAVEDDAEVSLGQRKLRFLHSEGHARHHYCIYDAQSQGLFCGDTFGASYPELNQSGKPFIFPPTTPVHFDPDAWLASIERLLALEPKRVYLTHFGMHESVDLLGRMLKQSIHTFADIAREVAEQENAQGIIAEQLMQHCINLLLDNGCVKEVAEIREFLNMDMELNAQGLDYWLRHSQKP